MKMYQTVPDLLPTAKGNLAELARRMGCNRQTLAKYKDDKLGEHHAVVGGKLMIAVNGRGRNKEHEE